MNRVRSFFAACVAVLLCISVCAVALGAAVCFTCDRDEIFASPAMREAVFDQILAGEDPALVAQLEEIPEFVTAQSRYSQDFAAWRYQQGEPWAGLTDKEASAIARALLQETLSQEDPAYAQHEDYQDTLQKLIVPLKGALQDVFPSFELALHGALRVKMDTASALIRGTAIAAGLLSTVVCAALVFILCQGKYARRTTIALALLPAAVICLLLCASFYVKDIRIAPLALLRDLPMLCAWILLGMAILYLALGIVLLTTAKKYQKSVEETLQLPAEENEIAEEIPEKTEAIGETMEEVVEEAPASTFIPSPFAAEAEPAPLFEGASSYDVDVTEQSTANMDALLAEAMGELFSPIPMGDPVANAEYLEDLANLFEGRVDNG